MKQSNPFNSLNCLLSLALLLSLGARCWATVVPTPADASLSADTEGAAYTPLTGPVLSEGAVSDISTGSIVFMAPPGFQFDPAATVTATVTRLSGPKNPITLDSNVTVTASNVTTTVTKADDTNGGGATSRITWGGITVRPKAGTPLATGNIKESGRAVKPSLTQMTKEIEPCLNSPSKRESRHWRNRLPS